MLRLNEFRILYPQYDDMTDYELSTALHQKGFANVPYEQFAREFGGPLEEDKVGAYVRQYNRQNPDAPITKEDVPDRSGIVGGIQLLGEGIYDAVTDTLPDSVARMWRGGDVGTGARGWTDDVIAQQRKDQQRRIMSRQEIEGDTLATSLYQGPQSVATSLATGIAGSLIGGVAGSAIPGVGNVAGAAIGAAGMTLPLFYRMAKDQFVEEVQDAYTKQTGHVLSAEDAAALNAAIDQNATEFGLWEAGPEALSQLFTVGLIGGAGGRVLKALGLGRMSEAIGKRAITRIPAKLGADVAEEEVTEGMTFMGQEGLRQEYGLRKTAPTIGEFAREQAGPVAVGSLLQMGVMGAGQKIHDSRLRKGILGALPDELRDYAEGLSTPELRKLRDLPPPPTVSPDSAVNPGSPGTVDLLNPPADNGGENAGGGMSVPQPQSVPAEEIAPAPMPEAAQGIGAGLADIHAPAPQVELVTPNALTPYQQQMLEQAEREFAGSPIAQGIAPFLSDQDYLDTENFVRESEGRQAAEDARAYANDFWTNAGFGDYVNRPASMLPNWPTGPRPAIAPPAAQPAQTTTPEAVQPPTQAQATPAPAAQTGAEPRPAPVEESPEMTERREELLAYFPAKKRDDMRGMSIEQLEDAVKELYAAQGEQPAPDGSTLHGPHDTYIKRGGRWTAIDNQTGEVRPFDATTNVAVENIWQGHNDTEGKSVKQQRTEILNQLPKEKQEKYKRLGLPNLKEILAEQKKEDTAFVEQALSGGRKNIQVGQEEEPAPQIVGEIDDEIAQTLPLKKKGKIVLDNEGLQHIEDRHGKELRGLGFKGGRDFVDYVLENKDAVYAVPKVTRKYDIVSRVRKPQSRVMIRLEFSENGDFYKIETAGTVRKNFYDKRQPLWESANLNHSQEGTPDATSGQSGVENNISSPAAEGKSADGRDYGTHDAPDTVALADHFAEQFMQGKRYKTIVEARRDVGKLLGGAMPKGQALKAVDEAVELGVVKAARQTIADMRADGKADVDIFRALVDLYQRQPNLGTRTSTSVAEQAYSTPVPLSFLASRLARIGKNSRVYEPTAGNGSLLIEVSPGNATVNELNGGRAERLRSQGFTVTQKDAAQYAPDGKVDVVIENPPFGRVWNDSHTETVELDVDGFTTKEIDQAIVAKSLQALKDNGKGRAVLIIGGKQGGPEARKIKYRAASQVKFWRHLFENYHVLDHFSIDGKMYSRQGASYPIDIVVLDTNGTSEGREYPGGNPPRVYSSFEELEELFNGKTMDRRDNLPADNAGAGFMEEGHGGQRGGAAEGAGTSSMRPAEERPGLGGRAGNQHSGGERGGQDGSGEGRPAGASPERHGDIRGSEEAGGTRRAGDGNRSPDGRRSVEQADARGQHGTADESDSRGRSERGIEREPDGLGSDAGGHVAKPQSQKATAKPRDTEFQTAYEQKSKAEYMGTLIPKGMADAAKASLDAIEKEHGDIDSYVAKELGYKPEELGDYFGAEQIDAIALAVHHMGNGGGFIIGDQTGIGKGRVNAAVIRWAQRQGKIPVFVTIKKELYADMVRDLADIGMDGFTPLITNAGQSGKNAIPLPDGRELKTKGSTAHNKLLANVALNGLGDYDAVFTTYDQLMSQGSKPQPRRAFLESIAHNAIFILDEAHSAGGSGEGSSRGKKKDADSGPSIAEFMRSILQNCPNGTFYSSATYAKRPDVMGLYLKTNMQYAVNDIKSLGQAISEGGIPMQQVVATMLTQDGQYLRRERSYEGAETEVETVKADKVRADGCAKIMRAIQAFNRAKENVVKALDEKLGGKGKKAKDNAGANAASIKSASFSSVMHNLIAQSLMAQKVDSLVESVAASVTRGLKPVIALNNTMESMIKEFAQVNNLKAGDEIDLTFKDLFRRYLRKAREVTEKEADAKKDEGVTRELRDDELGPAAVALYHEAERIIDESDMDTLPISFIDQIENGLRSRGITVDEITGRTMTIDYSGPTPKLATRIKETPIKAVNNFNNGQTDVIILNSSGSTGISLHASERFKDQRRRVMYIAQAAPDINVFMQTLGRVFRTGQVVPPQYKLLFTDLPSEKRAAALLAMKMASLNANTTAAKDSATSFQGIPDFINKYGDRVALAIDQARPDLSLKMGLDLEQNENAMRKMTGYIPLLDVKEQGELYDLLTAEYNDYIEQVKATGDYDLEATTLPLDAKLLNEANLVGRKEVPVKTPFADAAKIGTYDVKKLGKPLSPAKVREMLAKGKDFDGDALERQLEEHVAKESRTIKNEEARASFEQRQHAQLEAARDIASTLRKGAFVTVDTKGNSLLGMVTNIFNDGRAKSPVALSSWKAEIALNDASQKMTVSFSQVLNGRKDDELRVETAWNVTEDGFYRLLESGQSDSREKAVIVTGNLLAAKEALRGVKGRVIFFKDNKGATTPGILLPKDTNVDGVLGSADISLSPEQGIAFLRKVGSQGVLKTQDKNFIVSNGMEAGTYNVSVPGTKTHGGQYYLNRDILNAAGEDFVKQGKSMVLRGVKEKTLRNILEAMKAQGTGFIADNNRNVAREVTGQKPIDEGLASLQRGRLLPPKTDFDGIEADRVQRVADKLSGMAQNAAQTRVVQSFEELPAHLRESLKGNENSVEGVFDPRSGAVYLVADNLTSESRAAEVWAHEQVVHHGLRSILTPGERKRLMGNLFIRMGGMGNATIREVAQRYGLDPRKGADARQTVMEEVVASLAERKGKGLLKRADGGAWQRIVDAIKRAWHRLIEAVSGSPSAMNAANIDELLTALGRHVIDGAGNEGGGRTAAAEPAYASQGGNREEIGRRAWERLQKDTEEWGRQVDAFDPTASGQSGQRALLTVSATPDVLQKVGAPNLPMTMEPRNLAKILSDKEDHNLSKDLVKQLPQAIAEPIMVFESATRADAFVVLTELENNGRSVMVAVQLDRERQRIRVNDVASAYSRNANWYVGQIQDGRLLYRDQKKSLAWARTNRLQLPKVRKLPARLSGNRILTDDDVVKPSLWKRDTHASTASDARNPFSPAQGQAPELKQRPDESLRRQRGQSVDERIMQESGEDNTPLASIEIQEQQNRLKEWLSQENIRKARGRRREHIFSVFDNEPQPIAYLPKGYLAHFAGKISDNRIYSGQAYLIDHAVNHHPDMAPEAYLNLQEMFSTPDEVIRDERPYVDGKLRDNLIFVKNYGANRAAVVSLEAGKDGKLIFHKSLHRTKDKPYPGLPRIRLASVGGVSTISHAEKTAPGGSLSARDGSTLDASSANVNNEAPLASLSSTADAIKKQAKRGVSETVAAGIRQLRKIAGRPVSQDVEDILRNPEAGTLVGNNDIGWFGRMFKLPYWHAKDNAQFRPLYERQQRRTEERMEATNEDIGGMSLLFDRDAENRLNDKELKQLAAMIHKWDGKQIDSLKDVEKFNVTGQGVNGRDELELNPEYQRGFKQWLKNQPEPERVKQAFQQVRDTLDQEFLKGYRRMAEMNEIADTDLQVYRTEFGSIHNYFPHSREGKYFVTATVGKGVVGDPKQVVFRKHFDVPFGSSVREEWAKIVAANRKNFPGAKWDNPQEVEKLPDDILGAPIDPQAMEQIIKAAAGKVGNKEQSEKIQQLMLSSVSDILKARGWGAHGIQRQNIPGYEMEDIKGVLYKYVSGLNGWLAKMDAARDFAQELGKIDAKKTPRLWEYASTYVKDMLRNSDKVDRFAANVKNVAFAWYLGANFKTAVVNATQNPMVGIPRLDQYCMGAWGGWFKAAADSIGLHYTGQGVEGAKKLTADEQAMLEDLYGKGIVNAAYMDELQGQLTSSPVLKGWNRFIALLGLPMAKVEVFNRASLALAAYRAAKSGKWRPAAKKQFGFKTGQKLNNEDAAKFAAMIVRDSHFEYGKGNMPEMLRSTWAGRAMSPIYTFRSFGGNMLNLWARALGTERDAGGLRFLAQNLGMTIALGGLTSFPFYATVSALCAAASGDDEDWTAKLRRSVLPKDSTAQSMALYGLPAIMGITLSGSLRMETFMTEPLAKAKTLKEVMDMTVLNLLGIPYDMVSKLSKANEARKAGNPYRAAEALVPTFAANAMQAYRLATEGNTNLKGKPIGDGEKLSFGGAAWKAAGFQPVSKAEDYERYLAKKRADERLGEKRGELAKLFNEYYGKDSGKGMALMRKELKAWNDEMKAQGRESMTLTVKDVLKRAKRERTTRKPGKREKMREQERMARTGS